MHSCCMSFRNCNFKKVLTFPIIGARQYEPLLLVQLLNAQISVSIVPILPALLCHSINIFQNSRCLDIRLISFLQSWLFVNPLSKEEIFVSIFPSVAQTSIANDVILAWLNLVLEVIKGFLFLGAGLDSMYKLLAEGALPTFVWEVGLDWCRIGNITFLWSLLGSGGNCCSSAVA